jgi:hypothetical protein
MIEKLFRYLVVFLLGFLVCMFVIPNIDFSKERPFGFGAAVYETKVPGNWVEEKQIHVYDNAIVIDVDGASLSRYGNTGSMIPILDEKSNGIRIVPKSASQINTGDIITFEQNKDLIVHRVIEKGEDENGTWFITKGDNNDIADGKIYFESVRYVTIGVLY